MSTSNDILFFSFSQRRKTHLLTVKEKKYAKESNAKNEKKNAREKKNKRPNGRIQNEWIVRNHARNQEERERHTNFHECYFI